MAIRRKRGEVISKSEWLIRKRQRRAHRNYQLFLRVMVRAFPDLPLSYVNMWPLVFKRVFWQHDAELLALETERQNLIRRVSASGERRLSEE